MTANRSSPAPLPLSRVQHDRFKAALLSARAGALLPSAQRQAVCEVLQSVGELKMKPEQCVVAFKVLINDAANEIGITLGRPRSTLIERFVTLFIEEMYARENRIVAEQVMMNEMPERATELLQ